MPEELEKTERKTSMLEILSSADDQPRRECEAEIN